MKKAIIVLLLLMVLIAGCTTTTTQTSTIQNETEVTEALVDVSGEVANIESTLDSIDNLLG